MRIRNPKSVIHLAVYFIAAIGLPGLCAAADAPMRPGQWEITMQFEAPGLPVQMSPQTISHCLTPEQASDPGRAVSKMNRTGNGESCQVTHYEMSGPNVRWTVECTGYQPVHGEGAITFDSDAAYHGEIKIAMTGPKGALHMAQTIQAHRIGECKQ